MTPRRPARRERTRPHRRDDVRQLDPALAFVRLGGTVGGERHVDKTEHAVAELSRACATSTRSSGEATGTTP